jgi:hypothetical protein
MDNRIRLRASALPFIRPGETVQAVFRAQAVSPYSRWPTLLPNAYRVVVVTNQRLLVHRRFHDEVRKSDYELFARP